jgi:hypothetical protein
MGAWDVDTFDNDTACDWTYELENTTDLANVREALGAVLEVGDQCVDSDEACMALAACEVVARLKGNWGKRNAYTETVDKWVESHPQTPPADLIRSALSVIDRIRTRPSELLELWEEGDATDWHAAVDDLRKRVET